MNVNGAAKKYCAGSDDSCCSRGQSKIEEGIKNLNLGEIKNLSVDDVLGKYRSLANEQSNYYQYRG